LLTWQYIELFYLTLSCARLNMVLFLVPQEQARMSNHRVTPKLALRCGYLNNRDGMNNLTDKKSIKF
jgi:hypothetical protein